MNLFFPGAIPSKENKGIHNQRSLWREREIMFTLLKMAIIPVLDIKQSVQNWFKVAQNLKEPPRKRRMQATSIYLFSSNNG